MILIMLLITICCATLLVLGMIYSLPKLFDSVPADDFTLIVPLFDDSSVEMTLKKAIHITEGPCSQGIKIVCVDMGLKTDGLKIYNLISKNKPYISLSCADELKKVIDYKKINSKMPQDDI